MTVSHFEARCAACGCGDWTADTETSAAPCPECGADDRVETFPVFGGVGQ